MPNKITDFLFVKTGVPRIEKHLDLAAARQKLKSGNIANISTPGYKSRDIDFQKEFNRAVGNSSRLAGITTHSQHIPLGQHKDRIPRVIETQIRDGEMNSVDIDKEMSSMAQNNLLFTVSATLLQRKFDGIRKAITTK